MKYIITILLLWSINLPAQTDFYDQLKSDYDRFRKEEKHDSSLMVAKQMNVWALNNETDTSLRYAVSLRYVGNCFFTLQQSDSAEYYYFLSIDLLEKQKRKMHPDYGSVLNNLGNLYDYLEDYDSAELFYTKALEIRRELFGVEHMDYASSLFSLGNLHFRMGDYESAEAEYRILEMVVCLDSLDRVNVYNLLAGVYLHFYKYNLAEIYFIKCVSIIREINNYDQSEFSQILLNTSRLYCQIGNYSEASKYCLEAIEIQNSAENQNLDLYAGSLLNLGAIHVYKNEQKKALDLFNDALKILEKNGYKSDYLRALILMNIGIVYRDLGNFEYSQESFERSSEIFHRVGAESTLDYASLLVNFSSLYASIEDYAWAEQYNLKAQLLMEKLNMRQNVDWLRSFVNSGVIKMKLGDYLSADSIFKESLEFASNLGAEGHADFLSILNLSGVLELERGDFEKARMYFEKVLMANEIESFDFQSLIIAHQNMAIALQLLNDCESANIQYDRCFELRKGALQGLFSWLSEMERLEYWNKECTFYDLVNNSIANCNISWPSNSEMGFDCLLISKSLLLETSRELDYAIATSSNEMLNSQFAEMKQLRRLHSKVQSESSKDREFMELIHIQADSLDRILVNSLGEFAAAKRKFEITWKDVQAGMSTSDAAIEFARYYDENDSSYKYMALVIRLGYEYPRLVKLAPENDIKDAVTVRDFALLYELVWRGIDSLLIGVSTVYYSPAGELNNLAFSALCFDAGDSLISSMSAQNRGVVIDMEGDSSRSCNAVLMDKYTLHQLTTTRYLADGTLKKDRPLNSSITLLGGINYDDVPKVDNAIEHEESEHDFALNVNLTDRNVKKASRRSSSGAGKPMKYLEGTREEVTHIATQLDGCWSVQTMSDRLAAEHGLKSQLSSSCPGVLHIATHGFAFPDVKRDDSKQLMMDEKPSYSISEDPMVRCGLMLSGSNISWTGNAKRMIEQTGDDGILTAAEVSNLDLSGTKLVVLSACETGLGKIEGSEGTFGLKRGFKLAGVEQMIVSLWSVPDKETMELMTLFYTDLTKTLNPVQSFEKAQKQMRNQYPTQPDKWAGFVLVR